MFLVNFTSSLLHRLHYEFEVFPNCSHLDYFWHWSWKAYAQRVLNTLPPWRRWFAVLNQKTWMNECESEQNKRHDGLARYLLLSMNSQTGWCMEGAEHCEDFGHTAVDNAECPCSQPFSLGHVRGMWMRIRRWRGAHACCQCAWNENNSRNYLSVNTTLARSWHDTVELKFCLCLKWIQCRLLGSWRHCSLHHVAWTVPVFACNMIHYWALLISYQNIRVKTLYSKTDADHVLKANMITEVFLLLKTGLKQ